MFEQRSIDLLLTLVRVGISANGSAGEAVTSDPIDARTWAQVYTLSVTQGVIAIAWDGLQQLLAAGILRPDQQPDRAQKLQWALQVEHLEEGARKRFRKAAKFAAYLQEHGVQTVVLKGIAYAQYYPEPLHREFGDLDCFLPGNYEKGNRLAAELHIPVDTSEYKHAHISYPGLTIENHHFLTSFNGTKKGIEIEKRLQEVLTRDQHYTPINDTALLQPNPEFTALFLIKHAQRHFINEGIVVRHLLDWHLFLQHERANLDLPSLVQQMRKLRLLPFAQLITAWCVSHTGLPTEGLEGLYDGTAADLLPDFERDLFTANDPHNQRHWWQKIPRVTGNIGRMWHFRALLDDPFFEKLWTILAFSSYMHRNPKLD